jgi:hypothetical protein
MPARTQTLKKPDCMIALLLNCVAMAYFAAILLTAVSFLAVAAFDLCLGKAD